MVLPTWERGRMFGDYRLEERIARGGMGEVWRAAKTGPAGFHREVALKVLLPELAEEDRFVAMFMGEARIAARLTHPNIVSVWDFGQDGRLLWCAQEFVAGADLRRVVHASRGGLPLPVALHIAGELLRALQYAHGAKSGDGRPLDLVHRDVKPANVLIAWEGHVKLTDFGIAKAYAESAVDAVAGTGTGQVKGTAGYLAPEIIEGKPATARSDLFAVGVVLWEMLTRQRLFGGANRLQATLEKPVPTFASVGVDVPVLVEEFVRTLVAKEPGWRFESSTAALQALRGLPNARDATEADVSAYLRGLPIAASALTTADDRDAIPEMIEDGPATPISGAHGRAAIAASTAGAGAGAASAAATAPRSMRDELGVEAAVGTVTGTAPTQASRVPSALDPGFSGGAETGRTSDTAGAASGEVAVVAPARGGPVSGDESPRGWKGRRAPIVAVAAVCSAVVGLAAIWALGIGRESGGGERPRLGAAGQAPGRQPVAPDREAPAEVGAPSRAGGTEPAPVATVASVDAGAAVEVVDGAPDASVPVRRPATRRSRPDAGQQAPAAAPKDDFRIKMPEDDR